MDRMQIGLVLGLRTIGIPLETKNYREICRAVYFARQKGIYLSSARVEKSSKGIYYSPMSHESSGMPSRNLLTEIQEILDEFSQGRDDSKEGWHIDKLSRRKLLGVRKILQEA